jgi:hypothetical protein
MTSNNCIHYDEENGWCKKFSDWSDAMPNIEYCIEGPCPYAQQNHNQVIIDPKYKIGDTVWFADYFYDTFYPCKYSAEIFEIEVSITKTQQVIYYWLSIDYNGNITSEKYSEEACFASYEECTKWCDEHN